MQQNLTNIVKSSLRTYVSRSMIGRTSLYTSMRAVQMHQVQKQSMFVPQVRGFGYDKRVIDHYENPRNVGTFDAKDMNVGTGLVGAPACGDVMKLQIKISEEDGTIEKAVFKTFGCGSAIASSSYATELIEGMNIEEAMNIKNTDIAQHLKLPPVKLHCSMLAEDAIKAAITDYKAKKNLAPVMA